MSSTFWKLETMFQDKEEDQSEIQKRDCVSYIVILICETVNLTIMPFGIVKTHLKYLQSEGLSHILTVLEKGCSTF
jgi:hypothetical protein